MGLEFLPDDDLCCCWGLRKVEKILNSYSGQWETDQLVTRQESPHYYLHSILSATLVAVLNQAVLANA